VTATRSHAHAWVLHSRIEGCHFDVEVQICACGDVEATVRERDFHDPDAPYERAFYLTACKRCMELLTAVPETVP